MKRIILISTLLLSGFASRADYQPLELYEMIIKAEKIVYGTVIGLDSGYFTLKVEGSLTSDTGTLKIVKFQDWPCAARWTKYELGQRLFLFLVTWNGELVSMSGGNEGELPINNDSIYIHGFSVPMPPPPPPLYDDMIYFDVKHHNIDGNRYFGIKWKLNYFIRDVSIIRNCFNFTYGQYQLQTDWKISCDVSALEQMCGESKLVSWVYSEATRKDER